MNIRIESKNKIIDKYEELLNFLHEYYPPKLDGEGDFSHHLDFYGEANKELMRLSREIAILNRNEEI